MFDKSSKGEKHTLRVPWNKGKRVGQKPPLKLQETRDMGDPHST